MAPTERVVPTAGVVTTTTEEDRPTVVGPAPITLLRRATVLLVTQTTTQLRVPTAGAATRLLLRLRSTADHGIVLHSKAISHQRHQPGATSQRRHGRMRLLPNVATVLLPSQATVLHRTTAVAGVAAVADRAVVVAHQAVADHGVPGNFELFQHG